MNNDKFSFLNSPRHQTEPSAISSDVRCLRWGASSHYCSSLCAKSGVRRPSCYGSYLRLLVVRKGRRVHRDASVAACTAGILDGRLPTTRRLPRAEARSCDLSEQLSGSVHTRKSERSAHRRNHIQDPMSLCPARIYALCEQADFPRGERPLPVWGSKKYDAYHDYFDEWEERCATPVRTAARLANNTLVAPSSFPVQKVPSRYAGDGKRPGHTEWYFQPAIRDQAVRSRDGCLVYSFGVQHNDEFTNFWCVCPHQRTRRDCARLPSVRTHARRLGI